MLSQIYASIGSGHLQGHHPKHTQRKLVQFLHSSAVSAAKLDLVSSQFLREQLANQPFLE